MKIRMLAEQGVHGQLAGGIAGDKGSTSLDQQGFQFGCGDYAFRKAWQVARLHGLLRDRS